MEGMGPYLLSVSTPLHRNRTPGGGLKCQFRTRLRRRSVLQDTGNASHSPAATAAALPPELPPERFSLSVNGLMTGPWTECLFNELHTRLEYCVQGSNHAARPIPNSSQFVFPTICAPGVRSSCTTVASYGEEKSVRGQDQLGRVMESCANH